MARICRQARSSRGAIAQKPPRYSALKVDGQRLYDKARAVKSQADDDALEEQVTAKTRTIEIHSIDIESVDLALPDPRVTFRVRCGKGTYIRSMARDLGEALGVGAHLLTLRRLRVGRFDLCGAAQLSALTEATVWPLPSAVAHLPSLRVPEDIALRVRQGHRATVAALPLPQSPLAAVLDEQQNLIAVLTHSTGAWRVARGF